MKGILCLQKYQNSACNIRIWQATWLPSDSVSGTVKSILPKVFTVRMSVAFCQVAVADYLTSHTSPDIGGQEYDLRICSLGFHVKYLAAPGTIAVPF